MKKRKFLPREIPLTKTIEDTIDRHFQHWRQKYRYKRNILDNLMVDVFAVLYPVVDAHIHALYGSMEIENVIVHIGTDITLFENGKFIVEWKWNGYKRYAKKQQTRSAKEGVTNNETRRHTQKRGHQRCGDRKKQEADNDLLPPMVRPQMAAGNQKDKEN